MPKLMSEEFLSGYLLKSNDSSEISILNDNRIRNQT